MKHFHASREKLHPGQLIGGYPHAVYMTSEANPHYTIRQQAIDEGWFVYEVKPIKKVVLGNCWDEMITEIAEVVKCVGNARGIANNSKKNFREKPEGWGIKGSRVFTRRTPRI